MVSGLLVFGILALVGFWLYKKFSPKDKRRRRCATSGQVANGHIATAKTG